MKNYSVKSRVWIEGELGTYLGSGRIELLKAIKKHGSITKAAKAMKMSYKKAWELIDSMNEQAQNPLVVKITGGKGGGGTQLTSEGVKVIKVFNNLEKKCIKCLNEEVEKINW